MMISIDLNHPLIMFGLAIVIFVLFILYNTIWQSFKEAWKEVHPPKTGHKSAQVTLKRSDTMIVVYHNKGFLESQFRTPDELPAASLEKVAEIASDDKEKAFELTNHIDHDWTENEEVTPLVSKPRSTSVGDVMEIDGKFFIVKSHGFKEIKIIQ